MSWYLNFGLLLLELWLLAGVVLALHRLSARVGLAPLFVFMGGLTAALQLQSQGGVRAGGGTLSLNVYSLTLLPVLLLGLLIIYVSNGIKPARTVLGGMVLMTALVAIFRVLLALQTRLSGSVVSSECCPQFLPAFWGLPSWRFSSTSIVLFTGDIYVRPPENRTDQTR